MTSDDLAALHAACFTTPRPWKATEFTDLLAAPGVFLCEQPHGFLVGRMAGPEVELLTLAVAPQARRQGTGQALLQQFEAHATACNAEQAFLEVVADNLPAIALYSSAGYQESGLRKNYYSAPNGIRSTALVMTRRLNPS